MTEDLTDDAVRGTAPGATKDARAAARDAAQGAARGAAPEGAHGSTHDTTRDTAHGTAPGTLRDATLAALDVVRRYHQAWTTGDVEGAMRYVADDIFCRAPEADFRGKEAYQDYIASFAPELTGIGWIAEMVEESAEVRAEGAAGRPGEEVPRGLGGGAAPACPGDQRSQASGCGRGPDRGARVALFYYPQTVVTSTTPAAELFTVRNGRIVESVLAFDRLAYVPAEPDPASGPEPASPGTEGSPTGSVDEPEGHRVPAGAPGAGGGGEPGEGEVPGRAGGESRGGAGGPEGVPSS